MLRFINNEELNIRSYIFRRNKTMDEAYISYKEKATISGVTTSVNPWSTLLHTDSRKLKEDQKFTLMVDPYGSRACAVVARYVQNGENI